MPQSRRAGKATRETIRILAEPRQETAAEGGTDGLRGGSQGGWGAIDMRSIITRGYWTREGWWPPKFFHVLSGGMLQK